MSELELLWYGLDGWQRFGVGCLLGAIFGVIAEPFLE